MRPDGAEKEPSFNFLATLVHRMERVCFPRTSRAQAYRQTDIHLEQGVLNPC